MKSDRSGSVLVVDDDNDVLFTARLILRDLFRKVDTIARPSLIPEYLKKCTYDLILLDMNYTRGITNGREGLNWLDKILGIDPEARVLTTTAYGEIDLAVQAMKKGAVDFITKPWNREKLVASVSNVANPERIVRTNGNLKGGHPKEEKESIYPEVITRSPVMAQVMETIGMVGPTDANILILGENGTGKELAAWALHKASLRKQNSFVHVDLGSVSETLFESELFGHTRGAFTDAREERAGRFEAASGGTLFLDEIGNLTLPLQAKILTAIQKREVVRIGSNHPVPVDIRLISATNKPLYEMADSFEFRQDLLYRINTVEIVIPPLRERREDIGPIAEYYLRLFSEKYSKKSIKLEEDTLIKLRGYTWPGNIRELAHAIERAVILCKNGFLTPADFVLRHIQDHVQAAPDPTLRVEDYEKIAIRGALSKYNGNLSKAAEEIGIARSTLYRKIARFGIEN